jgi:hypothetical protein
MAVTVITKLATDVSPEKADVYAQARFVNVNDGHLWVSVSRDTVHGVYAPGQWVSAFTDEDMKPTA